MQFIAFIAARLFIAFIVIIALIARPAYPGTMTAPHNPFRPGFGESPTVWAGRTPILDSYRRSIEAQTGSSGRMILISGARGIGKTTLINELEDIASSNGWISLRASSHSGMLDDLIRTTIPQAINSLRGAPRTKVTGASIAGVGSISTESGELPAVAPTLTSQLRSLNEIIEPGGSGIQITVDEIQAADPEHVNIFATAIQDLVRDDVPISFIGAGLTRGIQSLLDNPGTTFLRRSLRYQLAPLQLPDAHHLLIDTALNTGREFDSAAAEEAAIASHGYPYLLQLIGAMAWESSRVEGGTTISRSHVTRAIGDAVPVLGSQVHQPELAGLPGSQLEFLHAMASVMAEDSESVRTSEIAAELGRSVTSVSAARASLIERDVIYSPTWGQLAFRLPYLKEFLESPGGPLEVS